MNWPTNITNLNSGVYSTLKGNADEMIGVGRCIKAGFQCSRVDITNGSYDAIIDSGKLLRIQIKGTDKRGSFSLTGGSRSGQQISREVAQKTYKYTREHCDLLLIVDSTNGDCYILPIDDTQAWGKRKSISKVQEYKENWNLLFSIEGLKLEN
jgi:hypothetical protein